MAFDLVDLDDDPTVVWLSVPASGGTEAATFPVQVEVDTVDLTQIEWPWPAEWPVTTDN